MERVVLLADPNSNAWGFSEKVRDYLRQEKGCKHLPLEVVDIKKFRNGEFLLHVPKNIRGKEVYFIHDSTKDPSQWWVELLLMKDLLFNSSAEKITFVLSDLLWGRQDRKDKPHVPISSRALALSLSYPDSIHRIITMDLHADQIQGFYPPRVPVDALGSFLTLVRYMKDKPDGINLEDIVVVAPDAGGTKRAESFAKRIGSKYDIAVIDKRRVREGYIDKMRLIGDVKEKDAFIIDDIIDSGITTCKAGRLVKEGGAKKLYCYGTHGLFTEGTKELHNCFERVMTSNTHYQEGNSVEIIDVSPVFAEAIYRAQKGESISELFE